MKTLKQIQEENRKFIIMANNPTAKTYEEALEMELDIGCIASVNGNDPQPIISQGFDYDKQKKVFGFTYAKDIESTCDDSIFFFPNCSDLKIIGKPLTLSRVLNAFKSMGLGYLNDSLFVINDDLFFIPEYDSGFSDLRKNICDWNPKKETLEDQSEETQREINKLLN